MYILQNKKNIRFYNNTFDAIFFQLCNFLFFCLQKINLANLSYNTNKKLNMIDIMLKLSLAVCFTKKTKTEKKGLLLPKTNIFNFQTDGFDLLYDAHARKMKLTKYFVGWFIGQQSKKFHNFHGARKYVYHEMIKNIKSIRRKSKEELKIIKKEKKKRKENILYGMFEKFQQKSKKKIKFFERKLYLRMRRQWIDYELIKIQRNIVRVRKFYIRTQKFKFSSSLHFYNKNKQNFDVKYFSRNLIKNDKDYNKKSLSKTNFSKKMFMLNLFVANKFKINKNFIYAKIENNA
jgi:hypothetical protein